MQLFIPYMLADGNEDDPLPTAPIVVMQLAMYFPENGRVLIGPHLMSADEIDEQVDRVIADAEAFRRLAKHELDIAQSRRPGR